MTATSLDFNRSLSSSTSEIRTRFAITGDNVRELNTSFNKIKMPQANNMAKLKKHNSCVTPAVQKPHKDKVVNSFFIIDIIAVFVLKLKGATALYCDFKKTQSQSVVTWSKI